MNILTSWFTGLFGGRALADSTGKQTSGPATSMVDGTQPVTIDNALQISAVWACASVIANTIGTLPLLVYENKMDGMRSLARGSSLWVLLHTSPNGRMTSAEFWTAMLVNLALRNNAYARIERDANGEAYALWPMAADQVEVQIIGNEAVYLYRVGNDVVALASDSVLHIKGMGNGTMGLSRLDYMRATTSEVANSTAAANKLFASNGKPTGVLMVDNVLSPAQREAIKANFAEMQVGNTSRLFVLEANMKYQQLSLSPEDMQILQTRQFGVEEVARWFGVPPVMIGHSNVTTWGSGIEQIVEGFYKFTVRPVLVGIEQAVAKRVLTPAQRSRYTVEFNFDGLLRVNIKDRAEVYSKMLQNGVFTRNEARQLENMPPVPGGDLITVQSNLVELNNLPNPNKGA
jgi:HK97 family phage portal protein